MIDASCMKFDVPYNIVTIVCICVDYFHSFSFLVLMPCKDRFHGAGLGKILF